MTIEELHDKLFEMLMMFDDICKRHGIVYYLDSGCAIGAVREHDFIPWDDDIDIAMMRSEYERLKEVLKTDLPSQYRHVEPSDYSPFFFDFIPRIIDTTIPLRRETEEDRAYHNLQNRMSIDIIILDSVPDSQWKQRSIIIKCKFYYGMARSKRFSVDTKRMNLMEIIVSGFCAFMGKHIQLEKLISLYENNTKQYNEIDSATVIRSNSTVPFIECFKKEYYSSTCNMPFHGGLAPLPIGYDDILRKMYGDYLTPKRDEKKFGTHASLN